MVKMNTQNFTTDIIVDQSPEEVFNAINDVRGWWSQKVEGTTDQLNDHFKVNFGTHWWSFNVIEMAPNEKVVWYVTGSYMPWNKNETEWTDTKICFEIAKEGDKTRLQFTHVGLTPSSECFAGCSKGWTGYMHQSLEALIKTGRGTPDVAY